jgi:hypothetical protein
MLALRLLFFMGLICHCVLSQSTNGIGINGPSPLGASEGRLGQTFTFSNINFLTRLNSSVNFPATSDDAITLWILNRQTRVSYQTQNSSQADRLLIFREGRSRNQSLLEKYQCQPSDEQCSRLLVKNFDLRDVGVYSSNSLSANLQKTTVTTYNVSAYAMPFAFGCDSAQTSSQFPRVCSFNVTRQVVSLLPNQLIQFTCSVYVVQNDDYPLSAQLKHMSSSGEECANSPTTITRLSAANLDSMFYTNVSNDMYNLVLLQLSKNCTRSFKREEINTVYSCSLEPTPISPNENAQLQRNTTYERLDAVLDIHYGPNMDTTPGLVFNKTLITGTTRTSFKCPFNGNPTPVYFWRVSSVQINNKTTKSTNKRILTATSEFFQSTQEYTVPDNLEVGTYEFECKAQVLGLINSTSAPVKFYLSIICMTAIFNYFRFRFSYFNFSFLFSFLAPPAINKKGLY